MERRRLWMMWWSGIFTVAALVHVVRAVANMPVTIGTVAIPMWVSWVMFPLAGFIAGGFMNLAVKKKDQVLPQPPTRRGGGFHPQSAPKEELQHAGRTSSGIQSGAPGWNDWPDDE